VRLGSTLSFAHVDGRDAGRSPIYLRYLELVEGPMPTANRDDDDPATRSLASRVQAERALQEARARSRAALLAIPSYE